MTADFIGKVHCVWVTNRIDLSGFAGFFAKAEIVKRPADAAVRGFQQQPFAGFGGWRRAVVMAQVHAAQTDGGHFD